MVSFRIVCKIFRMVNLFLFMAMIQVTAFYLVLYSLAVSMVRVFVRQFIFTLFTERRPRISLYRRPKFSYISVCPTAMGIFTTTFSKIE